MRQNIKSVRCHYFVSYVHQPNASENMTFLFPMAHPVPQLVGLQFVPKPPREFRRIFVNLKNHCQTQFHIKPLRRSVAENALKAPNPSSLLWITVDQEITLSQLQYWSIGRLIFAKQIVDLSANELPSYHLNIGGRPDFRIGTGHQNPRRRRNSAAGAI